MHGIRSTCLIKDDIRMNITNNSIAQGDKNVFLELYENMKKYITDNPDMLYKDYWRNGEH